MRGERGAWSTVTPALDSRRAVTLLARGYRLPAGSGCLARGPRNRGPLRHPRRRRSPPCATRPPRKEMQKRCPTAGRRVRGRGRGPRVARRQRGLRECPLPRAGRSTRPLRRTAGSSPSLEPARLQPLAASRRVALILHSRSGGRPDPSKRPRKEHPVRRAALFPILLLILLSAVDVGAQGLDLRIGGFLPRTRDCGIPSNQPAEYTLFQDVCELYAVGEGAFDGVYGGVEYNHVVTKNVEAAIHLDGYSETVDTFYRDYERPGNGGNIYQTLRLRTAPLGVSLRFVPTSKRAKIAPFVGGGSRRGLLSVRGVRRLHRLLRPGLPDLRRSLHRRRGRLRRARLRRAPRLREPRLRDRGRGALHVVGYRHGRRLPPQRAGLREPHRPQRLDVDGGSARQVLSRGPGGAGYASGGWGGRDAPLAQPALPRPLSRQRRPGCGRPAIMETHEALSPRGRVHRLGRRFYAGGRAAREDAPSPAAGGSTSSFTSTPRCSGAIEREYVEEVPSDRLVSSSIRELLRTLDPHSNFFEQRDYQTMQERQKGQYYGLGITVVSVDGNITVVAPFEGTPAHRLGIRAGDIISRIEAEDARGMSIDDAVKRLRGPKGTPVKVTIVRQGYDEPLEFTVIRDAIPLHSVPYSFMVSKDVGYVRLTDFNETTACRPGEGDDCERELEKALRELQARRGDRSYILDIRDNPGGLLDQAFAVSNLFMKKGQLVVFTRGRSRRDESNYITETDSPWAEVPLVVLTSRHSASASEIVAGALQDHDRGADRGRDHLRQGPGADDHAAAQRARLRARAHDGALLHAVGALDPARLRLDLARRVLLGARTQGLRPGQRRGQADRFRPQGLRRRRDHARLLHRGRDAGEVRQLPARPPGLHGLRAPLRGGARQRAGRDRGHRDALEDGLGQGAHRLEGLPGRRGRARPSSRATWTRASSSTRPRTSRRTRSRSCA